MSKIRDRISKITGFYFRKTKISQSFLRLQKAGQFDTKVASQVLGEICDYLEELEAKKKA